MPRKSQLETHPQRVEILQKLSAGTKKSVIEKEYGVSVRAINHYLKNKMSQGAMDRKINDSDSVMDKVDEMVKNAEKVYRACERYLADPDMPGELTMEPHASQIKVVYFEEDENGKAVRKKATLQELLGETDKIPSEIDSRQADPRKVILDSLKVINTQLELLARLQGELKDVEVNITASPAWVEIKNLIISATDSSPEVRRKIVDGLKYIEPLDARPVGDD